MLEMIGIGAVSLNVGEFTWDELDGDMGLICGIAGIPGTFNVKTQSNKLTLFFGESGVTIYILNIILIEFSILDYW